MALRESRLLVLIRRNFCSSGYYLRLVHILVIESFLVFGVFCLSRDMRVKEQVIAISLVDKAVHDEVSREGIEFCPIYFYILLFHNIIDRSGLLELQFLNYGVIYLSSVVVADYVFQYAIVFKISVVKFLVL